MPRHRRAHHLLQRLPGADPRREVDGAGGEQTLQPACRLGAPHPVERPGRHPELGGVGVDHGGAQVRHGGAALGAGVVDGAGGPRDQRQDAGHRAVARADGVVELHPAADLQAADPGGRVEQGLDRAGRGHLPAQLVEAGLDAPAVRVVLGGVAERPGRGHHVVGDELLADLAGGRALRHLDDDPAGAGAVVVGREDDREQIAREEHPAGEDDDQQHRDPRPQEPSAGPLLAALGQGLGERVAPRGGRVVAEEPAGVRLGLGRLRLGLRVATVRVATVRPRSAGDPSRTRRTRSRRRRSRPRRRRRRARSAPGAATPRRSGARSRRPRDHRSGRRRSTVDGPRDDRPSRRLPAPGDGTAGTHPRPLGGRRHLHDPAPGRRPVLRRVRPPVTSGHVSSAVAPPAGRARRASR